MKNNLVTYARTNDTKLILESEDVLKVYLREHPNSYFRLKLEKVHPSLSRPTLGYYFAEVVTKMQMGLKNSGYDFNKKETANHIKQLSPYCYDEMILVREYNSIADIGYKAFGEHVERLQRIAAEEFSIIINDPYDR